MSSDELRMLWWTKLRSTIAGVDHAEQVNHCLTGGLVGTGWRVPDLASGNKLDLVRQRIEDNPETGWGRQAAQTVRRFGHEAQVDDFVCTRETPSPIWTIST
jgi:hypothetical protein